MRTDHEAAGSWPAFVDLLAATTLLFLVLFAVIAIPALQKSRESQGVRTKIDSLNVRLERALVGRSVEVRRRASFIFLRIQGDATFPSDLYELRDLKAEGRAILRGMAEEVVSQGMMDDIYQFQVVGHASREGVSTRNWFLSAARAAAVAQFLVDSLDLDPCRVSAVGRSNFYPADMTRGVTESSPQDRRIEIEVLPRFVSDTVQRNLLSQCLGK